MSKDELNEAKATGEDSVAADAVTPAGGEVKKRLADKELKNGEAADNIEKTVKTPEGNNNAGLHETVSSIFEGEELSEEFKSKVATVFEAAVSERVSTIKEAIEAEYVAKLDEETSRIETELSERVDQFLEFSANKFMTENAVAIEAGLKVELAESLLEGLKGLFVEHNVVVDTEKLDTIEEMTKEYQSVNKKYTESVKEISNLQEQITKLNNEIEFTKIAEGLTDTQVDRLRSLAESISYTSTEDFSAKVKTLRESFFVEKVNMESSDPTETLNEEVVPEVKHTGTTTEMQSLAKALARFGK